MSSNRCTVNLAVNDLKSSSDFLDNNSMKSKKEKEIDDSRQII
ncbi:MAG TPA: hypothetical protein VN703_00945 [Candidatus Sulfopaludibacter sp.]|nr:hypothetical protein [Candidatus Sulfopaludibacter sp.]